MLTLYVLLVALSCSNGIRPVLSEQPLRGVHFRVVPQEETEIVIVNRAANGSILSASGRAVHIMDALSRLLGFSYHLISNFKSPLMYLNSSTARGAASYLHSQEADIILGVVTMTNERYAEFDMIFPWTITSLAMLIPIVDPLANVGAPWQPFQLKIWIFLFSSLMIIVCTLYGLSLMLKKSTVHRSNVADHAFANWRKSFELIVGVILGQGGFCPSKKLTIRLLVGTWCLATFVLINSYSCVLVSFLTAVHNEPFVRSIYDIPSKPGAHVVAELGKTVEAVFSTVDSGIFKYVNDDFKRNPPLRCRKPRDCVEKVKSGPYVFLSSASILKEYIDEDYKASGECRMTLAKETFLTLAVSISVRRHMVDVQYFNSGMVKLWETGLLNKWRQMYLPNHRQCLDFIPKKSEARLNFQNLSSVFVLLLVGMLTAFIILILEMLYTFKIKHIRRNHANNFDRV